MNQPSFQGDSLVAVLCASVVSSDGFICFVLICSSSILLLVPREGFAS